MPTSPAITQRSSDRRARLLVRYSAGSFVALGRYLVHRVPMYRRNRRHIDEPDLPDFTRELPGDAETLQRPDDGVGDLYHRRYYVAYTDGELGADRLIPELLSNLNAASPTEFSTFEPIDKDDDEPLEVGDELVVRLPGPWDGPVRIVDITESSFRLATLQGHMEAGEIEFRARTNEHDWTIFEIESWARSGDKIFHWLYDKLPLAREMQLHMWSHFCQRVVRIGKGIAMTNVEMHTCTLDPDAALAA